jgi:predicted esterase
MTREQEEARLEQAMQRGDELLVNSLKTEDRRRSRTRTIAIASIAVMIVAGACLVAIWPSTPRHRGTAVVFIPTTTQSSPPAAEATAEQLTSLRDDNWRRAFATGNELATMDPEKSWPLLQANWSKIPNFEARQQILKSFAFARLHPRVLDVMQLGMTDPEPKVRAWAVGYLRGLAYQDFAEDSAAYEKWRTKTAGQPVAQVVAESVTAWVGQLKSAQGEEIQRQARFARDVRNDLSQLPAARDAAVKAGALDVATRWLREHADDRDIVSGARDLLTALKPDETYLKTVILPLLDAKNPPDVRTAAIQMLGRADNKWAVDPLLAMLRDSVTSQDKSRREVIWDIAQALAEIGDPRAIPDMIAAIAHDNTYDTVYGVGYFGLGKMTGVRYDESHNGQWWRQWWERERTRFPEPARSSPIPVLDKTKSAQSDAATHPPIFAMILATAPGPLPVEELRVNNDEKMRYFLMGPKTKTTPKDGYRLLLVLPGGDGGPDFRDFVESIATDSLSDQYLVAELIAPPWSGSNEIVWPKEKELAKGAPLATEKFIDAVVADVGKIHKLDPRHIYALGWSSSGPPVYATAMRAKTPLTGAFIAMSVFHPQECPPAANAKGRAFYILHSPQDFIQMRFPQAAQKALSAAGAKVKLTTYEGGHGWHGDPQKMIRTGMMWLESQSKAPATRATTTPTTKSTR